MKRGISVDEPQLAGRSLHSLVRLPKWAKLDEQSREFLRQAEAGGMRYLAENGEVCAWGVAIAGIFSMRVESEYQPGCGEYLVTLPNASGEGRQPARKGL